MVRSGSVIEAGEAGWRWIFFLEMHSQVLTRRLIESFNLVTRNLVISVRNPTHSYVSLTPCV